MDPKLVAQVAFILLIALSIYFPLPIPNNLIVYGIIIVCIVVVGLCVDASIAILATCLFIVCLRSREAGNTKPACQA